MELDQTMEEMTLEEMTLESPAEAATVQRSGAEPPLLRQLAPELILNIITCCTPDSLHALRCASSGLYRFVREHERYICGQIARTLKLELELVPGDCSDRGSDCSSSSSSPRSSAPPSSCPYQRRSPICQLLKLWRRRQLDTRIQEHIVKEFFGPFRNGALADKVDTTDRPERIMRDGLKLMWAYRDAVELAREETQRRNSEPTTTFSGDARRMFLESLDGQGIHTFWTTVGVCAELVDRVVDRKGDSGEDDWDNECSGMTSKVYCIEESVLSRGPAFVSAVVVDGDESECRKLEREIEGWQKRRGENAALLRCTLRRATLWERKRMMDEGEDEEMV
ncbi:MAG: hypothetical protein M1819_007352 [Sarea resinae]|nr:MAG: hypothetical protein M1819_007352 [Sarea resinae]